jgi:starch synthase (maltosyl-transferring)
MPEQGRHRAVIEGVYPEVDAGRFPVKRVQGESVVVEADIFTDGHDQLGCALLYRHEQDPYWHEAELAPLVNDRWRGEFQVARVGRYHYTLVAWVDAFLSWRHDFQRRTDAEDIDVALQVGAKLVAGAASRANGDDRSRLEDWMRRLTEGADLEPRRMAGLDEQLLHLMNSYPDRSLATRYERELAVVVDRARAGFSAWYEFFPRSCTDDPQRHGNFELCMQRLHRVAEMGFDVVYLPPIHPIGHTKRKGPNNTLVADAGDPGSPWAIGNREGGHKSIHPELGTDSSFRDFRTTAESLGMEVAIDIAYQCSPDHPYVHDHPEWFLRRPDGSIQYAENPPKKYQDIYPFHFESEHWKELWGELESVIEHWIDQGVKIFRVDNPHTKPFPFWEWLITRTKKAHPEVLFLAEAFARPKIMKRLAKLGFSQSYTYFTWRNTKQELEQYIHELTKTDAREYFRPNFWPNTPDILPEYLQLGGRPAFMARLVLAATLSGNYGIYGPAFELLEDTPREPGSEEYLDSEKYQIRHWPEQRPESLAAFMGRVNRIRRDNPALHTTTNVELLTIHNSELLAYCRRSADDSEILLVVVNLDPYHVQSGWLELPLDMLGLTADHPYQVHDLLTGARYLWHGETNFVELDPHRVPAHVLRIRRRLRTERDFEYFF